MKSILLKIDDKLFEEAEKQVKRLKVSRNSFIKEALTDYIKLVEKKQTELELARESMLVRQESMRINKEFENTLGDGISDEY
ncbi:hypothetical protein EON73_05805 [bacterium]|nr:MAG: hypothetical protein EON73_05805 [bacterium]